MNLEQRIKAVAERFVRDLNFVKSQHRLKQPLPAYTIKEVKLPMNWSVALRGEERSNLRADKKLSELLPMFVAISLNLNVQPETLHIEVIGCLGLLPPSGRIDAVGPSLWNPGF